MSLYVQYGCGMSAPEAWTNFDVSPTLRIQKTPVLGSLLKGRLNTVFPENVRYGDIIKGLPVADNSCDGLYCSHTLEHLALKDFRIALQHSYQILKPGALFRLVVPDLEQMARGYLKSLDQGDPSASIRFIKNMIFGLEERPRGWKSFISSYWGNANHLWLWDHTSMEDALKQAGFINIRRCSFNDSKDPMFKLVEDETRFTGAVAMECCK
jgi:SAM-dependent methyltransferase